MLILLIDQAKNPQESQDQNDVFFSFFGNNSGNREDQHRQNETKVVLLQVLPFVLWMVLFLIYQIAFEDNRMYSFTTDNKFNIPVETDIHHVKYYLSRETYSQVRYSPRRFRQLESQIEQDAYNLFNEKCEKAKYDRKSILANAGYYSEDEDQTNFEYYMDQLEQQSKDEGYQSWINKRRMEKTEERRYFLINFIYAFLK